MKKTQSRDHSWSLMVILLILATTLIFGHTAKAQVVNFVAEPTEGFEDLLVHFTNTSLGFGGATAPLWTFPGGNPGTSTEENPWVTYYNPGTYNVTLQIFDPTYGKEYGSLTKTEYIHVWVANKDWGDVPDYNPGVVGYRTTFASNGAFHTVNHQIYLGELVDTESDGIPTSDALGDDINGPAGAPPDDEDGVFITDLSAGIVNNIRVVAHGEAFLNAWVDFNADMDWDDTGEQVATDLVLANGENTVPIAVPVGATLGMTYARFRYSTQSGIPSYDAARDGEVEDYAVEIHEAENLDFGDAPDDRQTPRYPTLSVNNGASHPVSLDIFLGDDIDVDTDGQPTTGADGDDNDGTDDEDGVDETTLVLVPGVMNTVRVKAHLSVLNQGYLSAWIDFDINNSWADAGEKVLDRAILFNGWNEVDVWVPLEATAGETYARFRFVGEDESLDYDQTSSMNGEVEDYRIRITEPNNYDFGDAPDDADFHYLTMLPDGARHQISYDIFLGTPNSPPDGEEDGQQTPNAAGDDVDDGNDDEDGIAAFSPPIPGMMNTVTVNTVGRGILRGWLDLNGNGQWEHPTEMVIEQSLGHGTDQPVEYYVPEDALVSDVVFRFRYSQDTELGPGGEGMPGEVEDYRIVSVVQQTRDFGDAPDTYPTSGADAAWHFLSRDVYLGAEMPDSEMDGIPTPNADGDDLNHAVDDEDGIAITGTASPGDLIGVHMTVHGEGYLHGWFDWNADGDWIDPGEKMGEIHYPGVPVEETIEVWLLVPPDAAIGNTYVRFRYTALSSEILPGGPGGPGEVEDYMLSILPTIEQGDSDFGDAPDGPDYPGFSYATLLPAGAYHTISEHIYLGSHVDGEADGQPSYALLDDITGSPDDEDGIILDPLIPGMMATLQIIVHIDDPIVGRLHGWIDFNRDGNWAGPGEYVTTDAVSFTFTTSGTYERDIYVPLDAQLGATYARFRLSTDEVAHFGGAGAEGEVEDHSTEIVLDFGDAPDDAFHHYQTLLPGGARHPMNENVYLGSLPDGEYDGYQSLDALGDDTHHDADEDGVIIPILVPGHWAILTINVHTTLPHTYLHVWFDWNGNGLWEEWLGEHPYSGYPVADGVFDLAVNVPITASPGITYARFRIDTSIELPVYGIAAIGEVEDYQVQIDNREFDFGDAPDGVMVPRYPTHWIHGGAIHLIEAGIYLGTDIDGEWDGQPTNDASGDDIVDSDDEDGVYFNSALVPGGLTEVVVTASVPGYLNAWADFEHDDDWTGPNEYIFVNEPLIAGGNTLHFLVPPWATPGNVFMRFRFCTLMIPPMMPDPFGGFYPNGEVEDYVKTIGEPGEPGGAPGAVKWYQPPLKNKKSHYPYSYWGWDEPSIYGEQIIADDWFCGDPRPVTGITWWGSYADWDSVVPPPEAPESFHLAIWTDIPQRMNRDPDHPGTVVWEATVSRAQVGETVVGSDFYYAYGAMERPDSCFQYNYTIPTADRFLQQGDSTYYWLSVSAIYAQGTPYSHVWGWKTRDRYFRRDALRILQPEEPELDSLYRSGETVLRGWDMSFVLYTDEYIQPFDFGDATDPDYPTEFDHNGAHHFVWPGFYMGDCVDLEPDGQSDAQALFDDTEGTDDEDGVQFNSALTAGGVAFVTVNASCRGILTAWIDYNNDDDWDDAGEHIFIDMPLFAGNNNLAFSVPLNAVSATTKARFRFSGMADVGPRGLAIGGEVEDYEVTISPATAVDEDGVGRQMPNKFELMQNYPNPFNPETTIKFQLPHAGEVLITVFDVYGREVRTLIHGQWAAGYHSVVWDGRDRNGQIVASGMYFYQLAVRTIEGERKAYRAVKKMIFMK